MKESPASMTPGEKNMGWESSDRNPYLAPFSSDFRL